MKVLMLTLAGLVAAVPTNPTNLAAVDTISGDCHGCYQLCDRIGWNKDACYASCSAQCRPPTLGATPGAEATDNQVENTAAIQRSSIQVKEDSFDRCTECWEFCDTNSPADRGWCQKTCMAKCARPASLAKVTESQLDSAVAEQHDSTHVEAQDPIELCKYSCKLYCDKIGWNRYYCYNECDRKCEKGGDIGNAAIKRSIATIVDRQSDVEKCKKRCEDAGRDHSPLMRRMECNLLCEERSSLWHD